MLMISIILNVVLLKIIIIKQNRIEGLERSIMWLEKLHREAQLEYQGIVDKYYHERGL